MLCAFLHSLVCKDRVPLPSPRAAARKKEKEGRPSRGSIFPATPFRMGLDYILSQTAAIQHSCYGTQHLQQKARAFPLQSLPPLRGLRQAHHRLVVELHPAHGRRERTQGALCSVREGGTWLRIAHCNISLVFTVPEVITLATACVSAAAWYSEL